MSGERRAHRPGRARDGVLFDLDGVLAATEEIKARAHAETVRRYGGTLDPEYYSEVMGRSHKAAARAFLETSGARLDTATYARVFDSVYAELLREGVRLVPGAAALVEALKARRCRLAVVSSSLRWMMDEVLARTGLAERFEVSVSADDVSEEKPSPQPYRTALARLGLPPGRAVVIEDSETGIAAAIAAGLSVIALRHRFNRRHDFSQARAELDTLEDTDRALRLIGRVLGWRV